MLADLLNSSLRLTDSLAVKDLFILMDSAMLVKLSLAPEHVIAAGALSQENKSAHVSSQARQVKLRGPPAPQLSSSGDFDRPRVWCIDLT